MEQENKPDALENFLWYMSHPLVFVAGALIWAIGGMIWIEMGGVVLGTTTDDQVVEVQVLVVAFGVATWLAGAALMSWVRDKCSKHESK